MRMTFGSEQVVVEEEKKETIDPMVVQFMVFTVSSCWVVKTFFPCLSVRNFGRSNNGEEEGFSFVAKMKDF